MLISCQMVNFPDWLANQMKERNMSPASLSRASKKAQAVIGRILNGERDPSPETLQAIAHALRLPIEEIYIAAGLLPPKSESSLLSNRLNEEIKDWSDDEVAELLLIARAKSEHRNRRHNEAKAAAGRNI